MKVIILAYSAVLVMTGCAFTDHVSFGVKRAYSYNFINDGSPKAQECQLPCQKQEAQCKQLAEAEYQTFISANPEWWGIDLAQHTKGTKDELCENDAAECMKKVCHGRVEKYYLD